MLRLVPLLPPLVLLSAVALCASPLTAAEDPQLKALIIDGQNNHEDWPKTTAMMKSYLEDSGLFTVDVQRSKFTWKGQSHLPQYNLPEVETEALPEPKTDPDFAPKWSDYDVVISNFGWKAAAWPEQTRQAFDEYITGGGGLVVVHAADNSFPEWPEFNEMIGLGGWGGRNEESGPYVYYSESGELVRDDSPGKAGQHGPQRPFAVNIRDTTHPITAGLPMEWMHAKDELYGNLRGPAVNMQVLATAFADKAHRGSGKHEPTLMALTKGDGRVFHSTLGHADYSMECVGYITTFLRGTEWAATGEVTQEIPKDFPTAEETSSRKFED